MRRKEELILRKRRKVKWILGIGFILLIVMIKLAIPSFSDTPEIHKSTQIIINGLNDVEVDERILLQRNSSLEISSLAIISPDSGTTYTNFYGLDINGRYVDTADIELVKMSGNEFTMGYYKLKKPITEYLQSLEQEINIHWKYRYSFTRSDRKVIGMDSVEAYRIPYIETAGPIFQKTKIFEKLSIISMDSNFTIDSKNFIGYNEQTPKMNEKTFSREIIRDSSDKFLLVTNRNLLLKRFDKLSIGEFLRNINFLSIDKTEEMWKLKIRPDTVTRDLLVGIPLQENIKLLNPEIEVNIGGSIYFSLPMTIEERNKLELGRNLDSDKVYSYSGLLPDKFETQEKKYGLEIFTFLPQSKVSEISLKFQYNPFDTKNLERINYYRYRFKYDIRYFPVENKEDQLSITVPKGFNVKRILSNNYKPIVSGSDYISLVDVNKTSSINNPLIIELEREWAEFALVFRYANIMIGIVLLPFVFWKPIRGYCNDKFNIALEKLIWPVIVSFLLSIEMGFMFLNPEPFEVICYTFYYVPIIMLVLSIPFVWRVIWMKHKGGLLGKG